MDDLKEQCEFVSIEAESNPESIRQWLSIIQDGTTKGTRRSEISTKARKHLSSLGWVFGYFLKANNKRELRYKSPNGKWFYSLATACSTCLSLQEDRQDKQIVPLASRPKRRRLVDCHVNGSITHNVEASPASVRYVPCNDVSMTKIKKMKRVEDCHTAAFHHEKIRSFELTNKGIGVIKPRFEKSLRKVLQVMEKKNKKCEKESVRFWRKDCGPDKNCDVCCVCHWGGDLVLCDGCPSAFHHTCLGLLTVPDQELWFCPCCCCDVCGSMVTSGNSKLMTCEQCQRRFHLKCLKGEPCLVSCRGWFCSGQCSRVFSALQNLLGCRIAVADEDLVWTLTRAPNDDEHYDDEQLSKLDSAVEILHQGFEPTTDLFSGRDLVEELIFKKDANGVGRGFYTVLVERNNEPITVAAMRVDKDVAEIPLVATLSNYRRSGMCRVLMDELEKQMSKMGVGRLVLPAVAEVVTTWTQRFGFSVMESSERLELVKHGTLDFVGTVMCHKFLRKRQASGESSLTE